MSFVEKVIEFNKIAGTTGEEFNVRRTGLYIGLIMEELEELISSMDSPMFGEMTNYLDVWSQLFKSGVYDKEVTKMDRVEGLDAFVDIAVVAVGGAHALGSDTVAACEHVADSNLSKSLVDDTGKRYMLHDVNGKVKKPDSYWSPKLEQFLV